MSEVQPRIPLVIPFSTRDGNFNFASPQANTDSFMFNAVADKRSTGQLYTRRRPGSQDVQVIGRDAGNNPVTVTGNLITVINRDVRGVSKALVYSGATNNLSANVPDPSTGAAGKSVLITTLWDNNKVFAAYFSYDTIVVAYTASMANGYIRVASVNFTNATSTDAAISFATAQTTLIGLTCFDQAAYIVLDVAGTANQVYASSTGNPTVFSSANFFAAPDASHILFLNSVGSNMIMGTTSNIFFYYDAANPTGVAVQPYTSATSPIRAFNPAIAIGNATFQGVAAETPLGLTFLGEDNSGVNVYLIPYNTQVIERIGDPDVSRLLLNWSNNTSYNYYMQAVNWWGVSRVLVFKYDTQNPTSTIPYVCIDPTHKISTLGQITTGKTVKAGGFGQGIAFVGNGILTNHHTTDLAIFFTANDNTLWCTIQDESYAFGDHGAAFPCVLQTPKLDAQSQKQKFTDKASLVGNRSRSTQTINIYFSDDDYTTWSTARPIDMSASYPTWPLQGRFRRRAYQLFDNNIADLQLEALELELDGGNS